MGLCSNLGSMVVGTLAAVNRADLLERGLQALDSNQTQASVDGVDGAGAPVLGDAIAPAFLS